MQVTCWDRRARMTRHGEVMEWYQKRQVDHYSDCEQMQVIAAAACGLLHRPDSDDLFAAPSEN